MDAQWSGVSSESLVVEPGHAPAPHDETPRGMYGQTVEARPEDQPWLGAASGHGHVEEPGRLPGDVDQIILDQAIIGPLRDFMGDGGGELLRSMQVILRREIPGLLDALRAAAEAGDAKGVFDAAHTIKGAVGNVGATEMAAVCRRIEESMDADDFGDLKSSFDQLERYSALVDAELGRLADAA
jgi:HPt (histidine-containing phosphotransfer) domain-containing protein